jgi:hypothetical protein
MGEMFVENQYRNADGNPYLWDLVVLETVRNEPNIRLFLNTDVHEVEAEREANVVGNLRCPYFVIFTSGLSSDSIFRPC